MCSSANLFLVSDGLRLKRLLLQLILLLFISLFSLFSILYSLFYPFIFSFIYFIKAVPLSLSNSRRFPFFISPFQSLQILPVTCFTLHSFYFYFYFYFYLITTTSLFITTAYVSNILIFPSSFFQTLLLICLTSLFLFNYPLISSTFFISLYFSLYTPLSLPSSIPPSLYSLLLPSLPPSLYPYLSPSLPIHLQNRLSLPLYITPSLRVSFPYTSPPPYLPPYPSIYPPPPPCLCAPFYAPFHSHIRLVTSFPCILHPLLYSSLLRTNISS